MTISFIKYLLMEISKFVELFKSLFTEPQKKLEMFPTFTLTFLLKPRSYENKFQGAPSEDHFYFMLVLDHFSCWRCFKNKFVVLVQFTFLDWNSTKYNKTRWRRPPLHWSPSLQSSHAPSPEPLHSSPTCPNIS